MEFITTGNRIAVENFSIGKVYTIVWATGNYKSLACVGKGSDFVMFQDQAPDLLFCLTMDTAIAVESIDEGGGGAGTMNYNELENKPSINGIVLVGNKTGSDLNLVSQADLDDYATNASVVAGLATKQDALSSSQLAAVNSGITSELVTQIGTNTSAIAGKQDALSSSQLAAVNSGITSELVTQIGTNKTNISLLSQKTITPTTVNNVKVFTIPIDTTAALIPISVGGDSTMSDSALLAYNGLYDTKSVKIIDNITNASVSAIDTAVYDSGNIVITMAGNKAYKAVYRIL